MTYRMTITAETLGELIGRLTEVAATLQAGDAGVTISAELAPLVEPGNGAPLPLPPPDYDAAGLTEFQQIRVRQAGTSPLPAAAPPLPPTMPGAPEPAAVAVGTATATPFCPIHQREMTWRGGGLSKNGKGLPLWSCPDRNCREAIWPQR